MIRNEAHYRKRQEQLATYENQLKSLEASDMDKKSVRYLSNKEALESFIEEISSELAQYEAYKNGEDKEIPYSNFGEIYQVLINARIAQNMTQQQLAEKAGLHTQQIQKYEANEYQEVKFGTLTQIAYALGIYDTFKGVVNLGAEENEKALKHLPWTVITNDMFDTGDDNDVRAAKWEKELYYSNKSLMVASR